MSGPGWRKCQRHGLDVMDGYECAGCESDRRSAASRVEDTFSDEDNPDSGTAALVESLNNEQEQVESANLIRTLITRLNDAMEQGVKRGLIVQLDERNRCLWGAHQTPVPMLDVAISKHV